MRIPVTAPALLASRTLAIAASTALAMLASPALASGRAALGEVWVYPVMFEQALAPLAPLSGKIVREGLCPNLTPDVENVLHTFTFEARMKSRGVEEKRWTVAELRLLTPSGCAYLDTEVERLMREAIPQFAEPRVDSDKNGWTRIPRIQMKVVD